MTFDAKHLIRWSPVLLLGVAVCLLGVSLIPREGDPPGPLVDTPQSPLAGSASCEECHPEIYEAWATSHHGRAEEVFDPVRHGAAFRPPREVKFGSVRSTLRERAGKLEVLTLGASGSHGTFHPVRVIGVAPLWQLLVAAPRGRYQVTSLAYDPVKEEWFDVYGEEDRRADEWGFWANRGMTWNTMCAACHVTHLRKNYDPETDSYRTTFLELGVGCESCHGPSRAHVDAMRSEEEAHTGAWQPTSWPAAKFERRDPNDPKVVFPDPDPVLDTCGSCHARRAELTGDFFPGENFLDHYRPEIPDEGDVYYPDGQVREEDYEYVSFLSSRMYLEGVRCIHCHNAHSGKTWAEGNKLCLICHEGRIDPGPHSHHKLDDTGGQCVNCHMPITTYMQRHPRRDHGFTIPDPLLTKEHDIPNACNRCHADKNTDWALEAVEEWYGKRMDRHTRHRARLTARAREGDDTAVDGLLGLVETDPSPLFRASAAKLLGLWSATRRDVSDTLAANLNTPDALLRATLTRSLEPVAARYESRLRGLLDDPVRLVRLEAAWVLRRQLDLESPAARDLKTYLAQSADHPAGALQQAIFALDKEPRDLDATFRWIRRALNLDSNSPPIHQAHAVALSIAGRPQEAVDALRQAHRLDPSNPLYLYDLALALNEVGRLDETEKALERTCKLEPKFARAWYNLALAKSQLDKPREALEALENAEELRPGNPEFISTRIILLRSLGEEVAAREALEELEKVRRGFSPVFEAR